MQNDGFGVDITELTVPSSWLLRSALIPGRLILVGQGWRLVTTLLG
jgi:hypothetical protein